MNKYIENAISRAVYFYRKKEVNNRMTSGVKAILCTCFCPIGDTVVALPFFRELKKNFPHHQITVIANLVNINLLETQPYIDKVIVYDDKCSRHYFMTNLQRTFTFSKKNLLDDYEMAFCVEYRMPRFISAWLAYYSGAPRRVAFSERAVQKEHAQHQGTYDFYFTDVYDDFSLVHDVKKNLALLSFVNLKVEDTSVKININASDKEYVDKLFLANGITNAAKILAITLTSSHSSKDWPVERFIELQKKLAGKNLTIVLLGAGKEAKAAANMFCDNVPETIDFVGLTTIRQMVEVISRCTYYLGVDTGASHIAAALKLQGAVIYKNQKEWPEDVFNAAVVLYPWQSDLVLIQPQTNRDFSEVDIDGRYLIEQISVDEVYDVLRKVVK